MKKSFLAIIILTILFAGCKTDYIITTRPSKISHYTPNTVFYYLPATEVVVELSVVKVVENKGPYSDYADEFLGNLGNIIRENKAYWEISDIKILTKPVRDTNRIWAVSSNRPENFVFNLTEQGFPLCFNCEIPYNTQTEGTQNFLGKITKKDSTGVLKVLDRGYKEVYDTIFKIEKFDTIQRTVPIIEKRLIQKSTREQAKELADKIFSLRDDKEALLVGEGDSEYLPDGNALKLMLEGIEKLEKEYLAQFIGRVDRTTYHYRYQVIPEPKNTITQTIIFRFSPKYGILPASSLHGQPVILELHDLQTTQPLTDFYKRQTILRRIENIKDQDKGLAYCIPEKVLAVIKLNNKVLAQRVIEVAQFGSTGFLPPSLFKQGKVRIKFYPNTGMIKSIEYE